MRNYIPNPNGRPLSTDLGRKRDWKQVKLSVPPDLEELVRQDSTPLQTSFEAWLREKYTKV